MKYLLNKDFKSLRFITFDIRKKILTFMINLYAGVSFVLTKNKNIETKKIESISPDGKKIKIEIYKPRVLSDTVLPCLVYIHGGGFAIKAAWLHRKSMFTYALKAHCAVAYVDYRLTPKYTHPTQISDVTSAIHTLFDMRKVLKLDKFAVGGDSAGGALAAGAANFFANPDEKINLCGQMLIYPVIDHTMTTESNKTFTDTPVWNSTLSVKMWEMILKDNSPTKYISPAMCKDYSKLPSAYVEVAEFDCLHDEGLMYAKLLSKAKVNVTVNETFGTVHGYDLITGSSITKASIAKRIDFLISIF